MNLIETPARPGDAVRGASGHRTHEAVSLAHADVRDPWQTAVTFGVTS